MLSFVQFFTLPRQMVLFVLSLVGLVALHWWIGFAASWIPALILIFLVVKYFILGTVNAAVMEMQMGDIEKAERLLNWTRKPSWLRFGYHGVYFMLKSQFAFHRKDYTVAEAHAEKALTLDLQDDMKAGLYLELINIHASRRNIPKVKELLQKSKKLNVTVPQLRDKFKEVEQMLAGKHESQQQMQQRPRHSMYSQAPSFMKRGGKK
jgi:tetratricopeptide (TPR) repeat protein